ncbi:aldo/keto reductase [Streptomyces griseofuscus]|uniref:aldo/keto reductase n=1 Tax=Streptomyces griseofuscus TaxID=146922 RepID=UPI0036C355AD
MQLHHGDPKTPLEDQVGELRKPRGEGKIVVSGLSQVTVEQTEQVRAVAEIATVQTATSPTATPPTSWSAAPATASASCPGADRGRPRYGSAAGGARLAAGHTPRSSCPAPPRAHAWRTTWPRWHCG